ncbi:hypothetical protein M2282_005197 [Variovorax boronicumulans]|uniref:hypothetical protein n=1 Tax=Variovorax boronicumulans TaxID=436515 RepID=UPI002475F68C|nr:hypothetical protein [Variovorax boronicumulans]MDH6170027.1 hypothetical protein [Variovorax boronicumulans]
MTPSQAIGDLGVLCVVRLSDSNFGAPVILSAEEISVVRERYRGYGKARLTANIGT